MDNKHKIKSENLSLIITSDNQYDSIINCYVVDNNKLTETQNEALDYWTKQNEKNILNADMSMGFHDFEPHKTDDKDTELARKVFSIIETEENTLNLIPYLKYVTRVVRISKIW